MSGALLSLSLSLDLPVEAEKHVIIILQDERVGAMRIGDKNE
jgi:hypothetical protein